MTLAVVLRASILTFQHFHCAWLMKFMCIYFPLPPMPALLSHTYAPPLFLFFYAGVHSCVTLGRNSDFLFIYFPSFPLSLWHSLLPLLLQLIPWFMHNYVHSECTSVCIHSQRVSEWVYSYARHINQIRNANSEFAIRNNSSGSSSITTAANVKQPKMLIWLSCCVDGYTP